MGNTIVIRIRAGYDVIIHAIKTDCINVARFFCAHFFIEMRSFTTDDNLLMAIAFGKMSLHIPLPSRGQLPQKRRAVGGLLSEDSFFLGIFAA